MDTISETSNNQPHPSSDHMMSYDRLRNDSICSDISDVSINEAPHTGPQTPPISQRTTPTYQMTPPPVQVSTPSQSPINAHHVNISDISSDMDSSFSRTNSEPYETDNSHEQNPQPPSLSPHSISILPQGYQQRSTDTIMVSDVSPSTSRLGLDPEGQGSSSLSVREGQRSGSGYEDITPLDVSDRSIDTKTFEPSTVMESEPHANHEQGTSIESQGGRQYNEDRNRYDVMEGRIVDETARPPLLVEGEGTILRAPTSPSGAIRTPIKRKVSYIHTLLYGTLMASLVIIFSSSLYLFSL